MGPLESFLNYLDEEEADIATEKINGGLIGSGLSKLKNYFSKFISWIKGLIPALIAKMGNIGQYAMIEKNCAEVIKRRYVIKFNNLFSNLIASLLKKAINPKNDKISISEFKNEIEKSIVEIEKSLIEIKENIAKAEYKDKVKVPTNNILSTIKILEQSNNKNNNQIVKIIKYLENYERRDEADYLISLSRKCINKIIQTNTYLINYFNSQIK